MALRSSTTLVPSISGEVVKRKVEPGVVPSWDSTFDVQVRSVTPDDQIPTLDRAAEVNVTRVQLPIPSFDHEAEVQIRRLPPL